MRKYEKLIKRMQSILLAAALVIGGVMLPMNSMNVKATAMSIEEFNVYVGSLDISDYQERMEQHGECEHAGDFHFIPLGTVDSPGTGTYAMGFVYSYSSNHWQLFAIEESTTCGLPTGIFDGSPEINAIYYLQYVPEVKAVKCTGSNGSGAGKTEKKGNSNCSHDYTWKTTKEPTIEENGVISLICKKCDAVEAIQVISNDMVVYKAFANELEKQLAKGDTIKLDLKAWHSVPSFLMERIISCGKDVELTYKYKGTKYDIVIEAGKGQNLDIPWYGPLLMNSMYGN